jgi:hypothetical protein
MNMPRTLVIGLLYAFICFPSFAQSPETDVWENDIRKFEHLDSVETYPANAVLFAGSSSIRLWSTLAEDMAPYPVIQRGYGGARLSDFSFFAKRIIYPHPCRAIVIFIANDITGSAADKTPEEVRDLFLKVLNTTREKFPDTPVFWIAITPTSLRWKSWPLIEKANMLIQEACKKEENTYFINTKDFFLNTAGLPKDELFRADHLHLNEDGYKVWTSVIRKELEKVIGDSRR